METNPASGRHETRSATAEPLAKSQNRTKRYVFPESEDDDDQVASSSSSSLPSSSSKKDLSPVSRRCRTRSTTAKPVAKSRIDWHRTKRCLFPESQDDDDESSSSSSSSSSSEEDLKSSSKEDGKEEETPILSKSRGEAGNDVDLQKGCNDASSEDLEEGNISFGKRKRAQTAVIYDSDESNDSDVPRKVIAKGRSVISEDDLSVGEEPPTSPEEKAADRKQERYLKLQELSYRRSAKSGKINQRDEHHQSSADESLMQDDEHSPLTQEEIGVMPDEDSMKQFIDDVDDVEEEAKLEGDSFEEEDYNPQDQNHHGVSNLLEKHVPFVTEVDRYLHFQRVVKAFLINAVDDTFLSSLYDGKRQKKYAQDMQTSLCYFDGRFIKPFLESLVSGCRWKERYRTRVDSYSDVRISSHCVETRICQACELDRDCRFVVTFSGEQYSPETLEVDDFLPHDTQRLEVGVVCKRRTQVYHDLKHYKYKLYQKCCSAIKDQCLQDEDRDENFQDEPVKDLVKRVFSHLEESGWIYQEYSELERYQDKVAEFQNFLKDFRKELCSSGSNYFF